MYKTNKATHAITLRGYIDVSIENSTSNRLELAAAWGLHAHKRLLETYSIKGTTVTFRWRISTFNEWLDIIKSLEELA